MNVNKWHLVIIAKIYVHRIVHGCQEFREAVETRLWSMRQSIQEEEIKSILGQMTTQNVLDVFKVFLPDVVINSAPGGTFK